MSDKNKNEVREEQAADEMAYFEALKKAKPVKVEFGKKTSVVMSVRMPDELLENASLSAERLGVSLNKFIKTAIEEKVASLGMLPLQSLTSLIKTLTDQLTQMKYTITMSDALTDSRPATTSTIERPNWKISGSGTSKIIQNI